MSKTRYEVSYTAPVAATPTTVYRVIADYHDGHPRILPSAFRNMVVEKGGVGAGTQTRFEVHAFGHVTHGLTLVSYFFSLVHKGL